MQGQGLIVVSIENECGKPWIKVVNGKERHEKSCEMNVRSALEADGTSQITEVAKGGRGTHGDQAADIYGVICDIYT